jgi:hypothetical protein
MEPSAVLVGAFKVKVGQAVVRPVFAVTQNKGVG